MNLEQWTDTIKKEAADAGFSVSEYQGFPLIARPASMNDGVRLIKFKFSMPVTKKIYGEGMLLVPAGLE